MMPSLAVLNPILTQFLPPRHHRGHGPGRPLPRRRGLRGHVAQRLLRRPLFKGHQLVFEFLAEAGEAGETNLEARERMGNHGHRRLGFGNGNAALAHAMGHSLGAYFKKPHGRVVGLFLPYTIEYCLRGDMETRYGDMARFAGLTQSQDEMEAGTIHVQSRPRSF